MNRNKGFTMIEGILLAVMIGVFIMILVVPKPPDTVCRSGYMFDRRSGKQLIGENGGGIKCEVIPTTAGVR